MIKDYICHILFADNDYDCFFSFNSEYPLNTIGFFEDLYDKAYSLGYYDFVILELEEGF